MQRALVLIASLFSASIASAQKQPTEPNSCVDGIPASGLKRVPVFLEATADSSAKAILPDADFFTQSVAFKIRELLGGNESKLPEADSAIAWSLLWGEVRVVAHRGGSPTWSVPKWSVNRDTLKRSPLDLLQRALRDVVAGGETVTVPEAISGDSVSFGLSFVNPVVTKSGKVIPIKARQPVPVFTIAVAWSKSVELTKAPHIDYPEISRTIRSIGNVQLAFAVDKSGRVDMESVKEIWPSGLERPRGQLLYAYEAFKRSVERALPSARFSPAMIGGCVLNQMVEQTFEFKIP